MKRIPMLITMFAALTLIMATGCFTVVLPNSRSTTATATDPLVGSWQMTRLSLSPKVPVPDFVLNQVISEKPTWKISRANGKLTIDYGGKDTWYNTLGISIQKKPTQVTEGSDKRTCTFKSGGILQIPSLPALISSVISVSAQTITVDFDDTVNLNLSPDGTLAATINVQANGKYYSDGQWKTFTQSGAVTYRGVRK